MYDELYNLPLRDWALVYKKTHLVRPLSCAETALKGWFWGAASVFVGPGSPQRLPGKRCELPLGLPAAQEGVETWDAGPRAMLSLHDS